MQTVYRAPAKPMPLRARSLAWRVRRSTTWRQTTEAIDRLTRLNRRHPSVALERELVRLRLDATRRILETAPHPAEQASPPQTVSPLPAAPGQLPEIERSELDVETLRRGIRGNGAVVVRGLFENQTIDGLRAAVSSAYSAYDRWKATGELEPDDPWLDLAPIGNQRHRSVRSFNREGGGVFAFDSPRAAFVLTDALVSYGIRDLAAEYLQAPPVLTIEKTTLRTIGPDAQVDHGWHQDGAFMGPDNPALNIWIALSDCGTDAPSMKFVPHRLDGIVPTGTDGAAFSWTVSPTEVSRALRGVEAQTVSFMPGDAIFFDEVTLHSTATTPTMTKPRMAIEAWMFGARKPAYDRLPLVL